MTPSVQFFQKAHENFLDAVSKSEKVSRFYRLAGFVFCIKFAGNAMVDALTFALKHLEIPSSDQCDLTICVWDNFSTTHSSSPIELPWASHAYEMRGEVRGYNDKRIY